MFENINFIEEDFFLSLPENIVVIGGEETSIDIESKLNIYDCVIRVNNNRVIQQMKKNQQNGLNYIKTDYIYSWYKRSIEHTEEILKYIPNLKGIITYADPYKLGSKDGGQMNEYETSVLTTLFKNQNKKIDINLETKEKFRINNSIKYYINYIDYSTDKIENIHICGQNQPNFLLKENNLEQYYLDTKKKSNWGGCYGFTSGLRLIFILLKYKKKISISGFTLDKSKGEVFNSEKDCVATLHDWLIEINILKDLQSQKRIEIL